MPASPTPVDRKKFGPLADDIVLLRSDGRIVAPFKGGFRVDHNPEIFSAVDIARLAHELRVRRKTVAMCAGWEKRAKKKPAPEAPAGGGEAECNRQHGGAITATLGSTSAKTINESCRGGESRPADTSYSLDCGGVAAHEEMRASDGSASAAPAEQPMDAKRCDSAPEKSGLGSATGCNGDTAGLAPGLQDTIARIAALEARLDRLEWCVRDAVREMVERMGWAR